MPKPATQGLGPDLRKQERHDKPQETGNRRLAEQIRKILRTHYTNKDRVR